MTNLATLASILETSEKNAIIRASKLHILPICNRCGGCGRYSFNGSHSICYDCGGAGNRVPKTSELPAVIEAAAATKTNGRFAEYMRYLDARKITKNATDQLMNAWKASGISPLYDWRNSAEYKRTGNPQFKRDGEISDINHKMAAAYQAVSDAGHKINSKSETYQADVIAFAELVTASLATVEAARLELVAYLEANPS